MVVISVSGKVIGEVREQKTVGGVDRAFFTIESADQGSLPMRYEAVGFGTIARRVLDELRSGDRICCFGRLSAGGAPKRVSLVISGYELLEEVPANAN